MDKRKLIKRIISIAVTFAMVFFMFRNYGTIVVHASVTDTADGVIVNANEEGEDKTYYLKSDGFYEEDGTLVLSKDAGSISNIEAGGVLTTLVIEDATTLAQPISLTAASAQVDIYCNMSASSIELNNVGGVSNYGTLTIDNLSFLNDMASFSNHGTVIAPALDMGSNAFHDDANAKYIVSSSFSKGDQNLKGTVVAEEETYIKSEGGSFVLQVGDVKRTVTGEVDGLAYDVVKQDLEIDVDNVPTIYVGSTYNLEDYIHFTEGYDGDWEIIYYDSYGEEIDKPSTNGIGDYSFSVVAEETDAFHGNETDDYDFSIEFYPSSELDLTLSGVSNGKYAKEYITINPPSGFQIKSYEGGAKYGSTLKLSKDDLYYESSDEGAAGESYFNYDYGFYLKRSKDGAQTDYVALVSTFDDVDKIIFDPVVPTISGSPTVDGEATDIQDGDEIIGKVVKLTLTDEYLYKVVTPDATYTSAAGDIEDGKIDLAFKAEKGSPKKISIQAYDKSNNEFSISFTLKHPDDTTTEDTTEETTEEETTEEVIIKTDTKVSVSLGNQLYGVEYAPTITTNSDNAANVVYYYKAVGTDDSNYTQKKPSGIGNYIVRAVVPASKYYTEGVGEATFSISLLEAPEEPYYFVGTKGKHDYYVSRVSLRAPRGYLIAAWLNGTFSNQVLYHEGMQSVVLMRIDDGAMTGAIPITEKLKIDYECPRVLDTAKDQDGKTIAFVGVVYADKVDFSIYDEHLTKVTLDGKDVPIKDGEAKISIESDGGKKEYSVQSEDEAGNTYSMSIKEWATWLQGGIIPENKEVELEGGNGYKLGSGKWTVTGDSTLYNGNFDIYTRSGGRFTFSKID